MARLDGLEPVTAEVVGEEFDVPADVAAEALVALQQQGDARGVRSSRRA
jgi:hypothetical protein